MCLSTITERWDPPLKDVRVGYKWMIHQTGGGASCYRTALKGLWREYQLGQWEEDDRTYLLTNEYISPKDHKTYSTGYHLSPTPQEAAKWSHMTDVDDQHSYATVVKVEYTDIVAAGVQSIYADDEHVGDVNVFVARKIKILEEVQDVEE